MTNAHRAAEVAARTSYGRLLSLLVARSRNIAAAEDALAAAFEAALRVWPVQGVPDNPEAWLMTAARNRILNAWRHDAVHSAAEAEIAGRIEGETEAVERTDFPDDRLRLLFLCAHPALDEGIRTPLMLQTVLGLDADRIARAFLVAPATMGQRLVRAKAKIRDAGLRFVLSEAEMTAERLGDVLDAIYVAFGTGWESGDAAGLTEEAIYLGRLIVHQMPAEPEPQGLLALMLYCEARRAARRDAAGRFIPLDQQDARLWNRTMIIEAEGLLTQAARRARFGRFQCEAAIQSVHVQRPVTGVTNWAALETLYRLLARHRPSVGGTVALAVVTLETGAISRALALLDDLPAAQTARYQPYWVARARILGALGRVDDGQAALATAIALTDDAALWQYLATMAQIWFRPPDRA
jgi:RNA polymerase sigma-70 factor (ECF subfamily)